MIGKRSSEVQNALRVATRALEHRGPDDEGIELLPLPSDPDVCVGLGSRRLAILDLSPAGHQPMFDQASGNWLIFNGEIYNFKQIRQELQQLGHCLTSSGDTEVLLKAYGQWGEDCLQRLVGMFAFAIWDSDSERLFLARDRLGEKPLYYYRGPGLFTFASELRALLATGLVPRRLDTSGLASYLAFGAVQDPLTIMEEVRSLPPGHTLTWEKGRCSLRRYWSLAEVAARPPATDSREEAVKGTRQLLLEAVAQRLVSDVPLGIFLSGGVDSSSIVAAASDVAEKPIEAFSVVFGERAYSEGGYAEQVARRFGCHHHKIELTERQLLEDIPNALSSMDQPTIDGINTFVISQATKKAGVTVALSGVGGDELFAGYESFVSVPRMMRFRRYAGFLEPLGKGVRALLERKQTNRPSKLRALAAGDYYAGQPYFLRRALFLPASVRALFPSAALQDGLLAADWNLGPMVESVRHLDPVSQVAVLEGSTYMANMLLRDTDSMSMAVALEVRTPLLHHSLWEFVLPLAGRLKLDPFLPKPLLLRAIGQRLPLDVFLRHKMGFTLPFELWMRDGLKAEMERVLVDPRPVQHCPLDARRVTNIWKGFLAGETSWSRPWALYVLKQWIRKNIP